MTASPPESNANGLQRRSEERLHEDWLARAQADPDTQYLLARGSTQRVRLAPQAAIAFATGSDAVVRAADPAWLVLLGWFNGRRCVLVDLPGDHGLSEDETRFEELRPLLAVLPEDQAQLLTYARALTLWRGRQRYCGVCGAPTRARSAGHVQSCTNPACGSEFFPRTDPAIIVLVSDGVRALLGRQASWPAGRYSALAGFVEPGESLEQTVVREVAEETAARVVQVRYFGSQPWPFPASLMVGFHAYAPQETIRLDGELEDARWFELSELQRAPAHLLPPPFTIARRLLEAWFRDQTIARR